MSVSDRLLSMLIILRKLMSRSYVLLFYFLEVAVVLIVAAGIANVFNITYQMSLAIVLVAIIVDIHQEVDGISRTRRYIERMLRLALEETKEENESK